MTDTINTQELRNLIERVFEDQIIYRADEEEIYGIWEHDNQVWHSLVRYSVEDLLYDKPETLEKLQFMAQSPTLVPKLLDEIDKLNEMYTKFIRWLIGTLDLNDPNILDRLIEVASQDAETTSDSNLKLCLELFTQATEE